MVDGNGQTVFNINYQPSTINLAMGELAAEGVGSEGDEVVTR